VFPLQRYGTLMETLRVTALVLRPINDKGNISNEDIQKITEEDLQGVERYWTSGTADMPQRCPGE